MQGIDRMKVNIHLLGLLLSFSLHTPVYANIKVGTVFFYPPFVMSTGDGFDIDLIRTICQRLQETCEFYPMNYNQLFTSIDMGKVDIAIAGIAISPERLTKYTFSLPYMLSKGQFLTLKSSNIHSIEDLKNKKVGVIKGELEGSAIYNFLIHNFSDLFQVVQFNDMEDLITAVNDGDISAAFIHRSAANYWVQNGGNQFQTLSTPLTYGDGIGIMALPAKASLIQRINQQLQTMEEDNSYVNLYKIYFGNE